MSTSVSTPKDQTADPLRSAEAKLIRRLEDLILDWRKPSDIYIYDKLDQYESIGRAQGREECAEDLYFAIEAWKHGNRNQKNRRSIPVG